MFSLLYFTLIFFKLTQDEIEYESNGEVSSLGTALGIRYLPPPPAPFFLPSLPPGFWVLYLIDFR